MQALAKAARQVAGKEALDVSNTAQLRDICLAAARIFGWKGEPPVNVAVNNQVGVVMTPEKLEQLREKFKRLQELDETEKKALPAKPAPMTLPVSQTQPEDNAGTRNARSGAPGAVQPSTSASMRALGYDLALPDSILED